MAIFTFLATWSDFFGPLRDLDGPTRFTVAPAATFVRRVGVEWDEMMAARLVAIIPA